MLRNISTHAAAALLGAALAAWGTNYLTNPDRNHGHSLSSGRAR